MTSLQMTLYVLLKVLTFLVNFILFFVPRFQSYDVAVDLVPNQTYTCEQLNDFDNYEIICHVDDLDPCEECDAICPIREFTWLVFGFFPKQNGDIKPFVNPNKGGV